MNRNFKYLVFFLLIVGEILINLYIRELRLNLDLLYLILVYISIKSGFIKSMAVAGVIGLITDYLSMNVTGVFGFSRTFAAFLLHESSRRIDLKNNFFVFFMIFFSLAVSNFIANLFFLAILSFPLSLRLILVQPLLTGVVGIVIASSKKAKGYLDVY